MTEKKLPSTLPRLARWRISIQASFLVVWLFPFIRIHSICSPVFHCYACPLASFACPIGVIAQFSALHVVPFLAIGTIVVAGALFGAFICGYACPFGFLQDLIGKIPTPKFHLPNWTGYFRYAVLLGFVLIFPFFFGERIGESTVAINDSGKIIESDEEETRPPNPLFICNVCPAGAIEGAAPAKVSDAIAGRAVTWPNPYKVAITVIVLIAMFFKMRPWCRILCPLGAVFGLFNRTSALYMHLDTDRCDECRLCSKKCTYGVVAETELRSTNCIRCMECTSYRCGAISATSIFRRKKKQPVETVNESSTSEER